MYQSDNGNGNGMVGLPCVIHFSLHLLTFSPSHLARLVALHDVHRDSFVP